VTKSDPLELALTSFGLGVATACVGLWIRHIHRQWRGEIPLRIVSGPAFLAAIFG
jgi:hypothetical protein